MVATVSKVFERPSSYKRHGASTTRLYRIWKAMRLRCYYKSHKAFKRYGGRGITVCEEWKRSFLEFRKWAASSGYQDGLTIDRINNDAGYSPTNCRWLTLRENSIRGGACRAVTVNGETKPIYQWADDPRCSVTASTIGIRLFRGWSDEDAVLRPPKRRKCDHVSR